MAALDNFLATHVFWTWVALAAVLLAAEVGTASGYLLWPAASAGVVAVAQLVLRLGWTVDFLTFAVLTIASTIIAHRVLPRPMHALGPDINDRATGLVGRSAQAVGDFSGGRGRVFVDGVEWIAEMDAADAPPAPGATVQVVAVLGGGRLKVTAAKQAGA